MIVFGLALFGLGLVTHTIFLWVAGVGLMLIAGLRMIGKSKPATGEPKPGDGPRNTGGMWQG